MERLCGGCACRRVVGGPTVVGTRTHRQSFSAMCRQRSGEAGGVIKETGNRKGA
jgi:hypothetical protein